MSQNNIYASSGCMTHLYQPLASLFLRHNMEKTSAKALEYDFIFKVVLIGDASTGKTNLLLRHTRNQFDSNSRATIGVEYACKELLINHKRIQVQVWDTAGDERFRSVIPLYYRNSEGALVIFDLTEPESFHHVKQWIGEVHRHASANVSIVLVGNKSDLFKERRVTRAQATALAEQLDISYVETSAFTASNVEQAFTALTMKIYQTKMPRIIDSSSPSLLASRPTLPLSSSTIPIWSDAVNENSEQVEPLRLSDTKNAPKKSKCC